MDKCVIRISENWSKTSRSKTNIATIDARELYHYSICQLMPAGLYTGWEVNSESGKTKPCQKKTERFGNMVMSYFRRIRLECILKSFCTTSTQKKSDA